MALQLLAFGSPLYQASLALREQVLRVPLGRKLDAYDLEGEAQQWHWAYVEQETLLACLVIRPEQKPLARLRQMAVQPALQGQGLGSRLVLEVGQQLLDQGFDEIRLHARVTALAFYRQLGFQTLGSPFAELGIPHVLMNKRLVAGDGPSGVV